MEQRVSLITLGVGDLQRSRDFYESLGWKRVNSKADGIVFFQVGGTAKPLLQPERAASPVARRVSSAAVASCWTNRGQVVCPGMATRVNLSDRIRKCRYEAFRLHRPTSLR
jgi:catechol 2,3-dioxygenase-like lactoylglutathione lyase family enzyme